MAAPAHGPAPQLQQPVPQVIEGPDIGGPVGVAEAPAEGEESRQQLGGLARGEEGGQGEQGGGQHLEGDSLDHWSKHC